LRIHACIMRSALWRRCAAASARDALRQLTGAVAGATWPRISRLTVHGRFEQMLEQLEIHVSLPPGFPHMRSVRSRTRAQSSASAVGPVLSLLRLMGIGDRMPKCVAIDTGLCDS
jgi:hypothetical protein